MLFIGLIAAIAADQVSSSNAAPVHSMGVGTLFGGVAFAFTVFFSGSSLLDHGYPSYGKPVFGVFALWIVPLMIFIQVKTEPQKS